MALGQSRPVDLAQTGGGHRIVGKLLEQLISRGPQLLLDRGQGNLVIKGGQVVLQFGQLLQPIAPHQVGPGGQRLSHLDETGPQLGEGVEDAAAQPLLHLGITAIALQQQHHSQGRQLPQHHRQAADQGPGAL